MEMMAGDKLVIVERADMIQRAFRQVRGVEQIEPPFLARRRRRIKAEGHRFGERVGQRSEEHTSELQSLMSTSYAVFCLKKKLLYEITLLHVYTVSITT